MTLGSIMAKMHNHAEHWREPVGFTRHAWDVDGLTGDRPFWGRFWELPGPQFTAEGQDARGERQITHGTDRIGYGAGQVWLNPR